MSWVTCEPKSRMRILSCPASRSEPAPPRTREESRTVIYRPMCDPLPARSRPQPAFTTGWENSKAKTSRHLRRGPPLSEEYDVARIDRRAVHERDDVVRGAAVIVHLPMRGIDVSEGRARAVADEHERVAGGCALSGEVDDGVAVALARTEQEHVVARAARELIGADAAVEEVCGVIADEMIRQAVAVTMKVAETLMICVLMTEFR